jgi:RimJ/RimL family protein N-acetyltransferase
MPAVTLRAIDRDDLPLLAESVATNEQLTTFAFFGYSSTNAFERRFAADGFISDDSGSLAVIDENGALAGTVGWHALQHGPSRSARALNIGIELFAEARGRGIGTSAQRAISEYLFTTTLIERLEATTDIENIAEQRALGKAGFTQEGVVRHGQFRAGE